MEDIDAALVEAIRAGSADSIVKAVKRGADVNACDEGGETSLTYATTIGLGVDKAEECVRCLLHLGARVSYEHPRGGLGTSVHQAAAHGYTGALKALLAADGSVALTQFDDIGRTPLICAVQNGRLIEASLLLEAGADVNAHDIERIGNTALIVAVQNKDLPMATLLIQKGANPKIQGWMQLSALDRARDWAPRGMNSDMYQILQLLEKTADLQHK